MAIRTGQTETMPREGQNDGAAGEVKTFDKALIARDCNGEPYIPATTAKGLLRSIGSARLSDTSKEAIWRLFGDMPRQGRRPDPQDESNHQSQGGSVEFRDAFLIQGTDTILERGQTRINRQYGVAAHESLRFGQYVEAGTSYSIEMVIDRTCQSDIELLCSLLGALDGVNPNSRLGGGGGALVKFDLKEVCHWGIDEIKAWLAAMPPGNWKDCGTKRDESLDWFLPPPDPGTTTTIALRLPIAGYFLISQPRPEDQDEAGKNLPQIVPIGNKGGKTKPDRAYLPKKSLKGALRSQAERICRTLGYKPSDLDWTNTPVESLFGTTDRQGLLRYTDLLGGLGTTPVVVDMVAIDRLAGAASDGSKFAVEAWEAPVLEGTLHVMRARQVNFELTGKPRGTGDVTALDDCALGLLALVLRDLGEGDIALGYGSRKGMGRVVMDGWAWQKAIRLLGDDTQIGTYLAAFRTWAKDNQPASVESNGTVETKEEMV